MNNDLLKLHMDGVANLDVSLFRPKNTAAWHTEFEQYIKSAPYNTIFLMLMYTGYSQVCMGYKDSYYGSFILHNYSNNVMHIWLENNVFKYTNLHS